MEWDIYFCDIVTDHLGFPKQLSVSLYLLPVLRGQFGTKSMWLVLRLPVLYAYEAKI